MVGCLHLVSCPRGCARSTCQNSHPFRGSVMCHCTCAPRSASPVTHRWTLGLLLEPSGCCEHGCRNNSPSLALNPFGFIPRSGIAVSRGRFLLVFRGTSTGFGAVAPFMSLPAVPRALFLHVLAHAYYLLFCFLNGNHFNRCERGFNILDDTKF